MVPNPATGAAAAFVWGPRQIGKTTLLKTRFADAMFYDLLDSAVSAELSLRPRTLREALLAIPPGLTVLDEIQKVPQLLDEVHWLLENTAHQFILCGSSARKLRRVARNLLGGRAIEHHLYPLTTKELGERFDLTHALNVGLIPIHYFSPNPKPLLKSYVNAYLKEEVLDESLTRNVPAFVRFLELAALSNGEQLNYATIARDCGVSASTVRSYYQILRDTLLGYDLAPWRKSTKRRMVETAKHYFFDVGVAGQLHPEIQQIVPGSAEYGRAYEHLLINEVRAFLAYAHQDIPLRYWRTSSGLEVDLVIGNMAVACEFKSAAQLRHDHTKGLRALAQEHPNARTLLVYTGTQRQRRDAVEVWPWQEFCAELWAGKLI